MMKVKNVLKFNIFLIILFVFLFYFYTGIVFAESCPAKTTVKGTSVTFVGELTDMGGDSTTYVWFQYGETTNYGKETPKKELSSPGVYCIQVNGLEPNTTYHYRAVAQNSAGTAYGEDKTFTTSAAPFVDIKANGSDGPVSVNYGEKVTLSWTSSGTDSCQASGDWSGTKPVSGSESTSEITSKKEYKITCTGSAGSASDTVFINVSSTPNLKVEKFAKNLSDGTDYSKEQVSADPDEIIVFLIKVKAEGSGVKNVKVKDILPPKMFYLPNTLEVDGKQVSGNISFLDIGDLVASQEKEITFRVKLLGADNFSFGETVLVNTVNVSADNLPSVSDSVKIIVNKKGVLGATTISTGLTNNFFLDSFFLPLIISLALVYFLKIYIVKFEKWVDEKKRAYKEYRINKILASKTRKVRFKEIVKKQ